jgi:hypothetical protein
MGWFCLLRVVASGNSFKVKAIIGCDDIYTSFSRASVEKQRAPGTCTCNFSRY